MLDLATRIKGAQDPEIQLMNGWLQSWGASQHTEMSGDQMQSTGGMMSPADMDALHNAPGTAFDARWSQMMIRHHEGAIAMAKTVKAEGSDPVVAELADGIIAAQQAEIDEMQALTKN